MKKIKLKNSVLEVFARDIPKEAVGWGVIVENGFFAYLLLTEFAEKFSTGCAFFKPL